MQVTRRCIIRFLTLVLASSTLSIITPQVAVADTSGTGICQQTFTKTGTGQVDVTESGGYCYVAFKNTGAADSQVTYSWTRPAGVTSVDLLVVGGGGSGGARHGGGGGAGGFVQTDAFTISSAATVSIAVGAGGNGSTNYYGTIGQSSYFKSSSNGLTALGGGAGANNATAGSGGSGGGAGASQTPGGVTAQTQTSFSGTTLNSINFGSSGAAGASDSNNAGDNNDYWAGGGGGGAAAAGENPRSNGSLTIAFPINTSTTAVGGKGGDGKSVSWITPTIASALTIGHTSSSTVYFAGGGGGGMGVDGQAGGPGGLGGGATGSRTEANGNAGTAYTGGGGGGSGFDDINKVGSPATVAAADAGDGGSGVVVLRYSVSACSPTSVSSGGYTILSFTSTTICSWSVPAGVTTADILLVGGGGAGGTASNGAGGGGGGGQVNVQAGTSLTGVISIQIGSGGTPNPTVGSSTAGGNGGSTSFTPTTGSAISATGGSGGASVTPPGGAGNPSATGFNGGGGAAWASSSSNGTNGVGGNKGGNAWPDGSVADPQAGGGGGGSGGAGANAASGAGGAGGVGISNSYTGSAVFYGAGGGGGKRTSSGTAGSGGNDGGGAGGKVSVGSNARANTGGGGGGGGGEAVGGSGGSGIIVLRYANAPSISLSSNAISAVIGSLTSYSITQAGGAVTSYSIPSADSTALSAVGISFSTSTGLISGTPTATLASRSVTITATNSTGTSTATFSIVVNNPTCSVSAPPSGGYTILSFTNTSTCNWTVPTGVTSAEVLVVAGGGGGNRGVCGVNYGAGGGGGGVSLTTESLTPAAAVAISVGAGGSAALINCNGTRLSDNATGFTPDSGTNGGNSSFGSVSVTGGVAPLRTSFTGGTSGNGKLGATIGTSTNPCNLSVNNCGAGGGGGAQNAGSGLNGGAGITTTISGASVMYGGGGPGKNNAGSGTSGNGLYTAGYTPTANTGGGGSDVTAGAAGIVIVKYAMPAVSITTPSAGLTGSLGSAYSLLLSTSGGSGSGTFSIASGLLPAGVTLNTSSGEISGTPTATGTYAITARITDSNTTVATTSFFSIVINSNVATLSNLVLSSGTLAPTFASGTTTYTASVANAIATGYTVTATKTNSNATTVQYIGATGTAAFDGTLSVGENIIRTVVTAQNGTTTSTYTVTVTRDTPAAALTPTFGTPTATATGYTVQISNYDNSYTWAGSATASGSVAINGTGLVTVTGVAPGTSSTATITTTRTGYTNGSATVTATSLSLYTVTYDATTNGGTAISPLTANFTVGGTALVLPTPVTRTGYTASGWYTTAAVSGTKIADAGGSYTPTSTGTIYFRWSANTYTITYKAGPDGSGSDLTQGFEFGNTATLKDATAAFTRSGYAISGWTTGATSASAKTNDLSSSYTSAANLILYPVWSASTYTITYKAGTGGSGSDLTQTFVYGNTATLKDATAALTKSGYAISGWSTTDGGSQSYALSGSYSAAANINLYPVWAANTYTITYKKGTNGTGSDVIQSFTFGNTATLGSASTALIRVGYTISGWSTTDGGSKTNDLSSSYSTAANLILYPVWNANTYTVTYDATTNGGTALSPNTSSYTVAGSTLTLKTPVARTGYTASGWYDASTGGTKVGNAGATGYTPTSDVTLYFQWTPIQYTVTYNGNSNTGGAVPTNASTYTISSTVTVAANSGALVNTGYTFAGWTDNSSGTGTVYTSGTSYTVSNENIVFYAKWSANTYTITYNPNGGSGSASATTDTYTTAGASVTLPTFGTLSKTGYNFGGWSTTTSGSALVGGYTTSSDVTLYARWTVKIITVTYDKGVASAASIASWPTNDSGNYNTTITLGTPTSQVTISGGTYQFSSWKVSGTTVTYESGATYTLPATNPTLVAQWVQVFEVNYTLNGGTSATGFTYDAQCDPGTFLCTNGQSIQADAAPTRTGYTFTGWRDQSGNPIAAGATFTVTLNRYLLSAQWSAIDYNISYAAAGGGAVPATFTKQITQSFTVANAISKTGYTFAGWSDGTLTYGAGANYIVSSNNVTLTAQWTPNVYTITYDWNGGSGSSTASTSYTVGDLAVTLPLVGNHVKDGYQFGGWSTTSSGSSVGAAYTPTSSLTLFAVWGSGTFTITYNANGGSTGTASASVVNGAATTLPTATRTSYEFNGWYSAASGGSLIGLANASYTPALSRTLYAQWTQLSLSGISPSDLTYIGTLSASSSIDASFSGSNSGSSVSVSVPAGSLPNGTSVNLHLVGNFSRAQSLISSANNYIVSIVVSWMASDGTVPDTAAGKPVTVVISNSTIKRGMSVYSIVGPTVTLLGTAAADGSITVALTSDPEVIVAATKPGTPTTVLASTGADASSVISWSAPSSDGGSAITRYTATSSGGQSCTTTNSTTCTITGLTNGTAYTFTVTATNVIGTSIASSTSASATPAGGSSGGSSGGRAPTPVEPKKDDKPITPGQGTSGGNPVITVEKKPDNVKLSWQGPSQVTLIIENSNGDKRNEVVIGNTLTLPKPKPGEGYKVSSDTPLADGTFLKDYIVAEPPTQPVTFNLIPSKVVGTVSTIRASWKATSTFERFSVKVTPARGKAFVISTDKPSALIDLPQGTKYTVTVTAIGFGSLNSKVLTKVISVPKRR